MADAVTTHVVKDSAGNYIVHLINVSDGTGEAAVIKVDKSAIAVATDGAEAASLDIEMIRWNCVGMSARILWDHTTDDLAFVCDGVGEVDFKRDGVGREVGGDVLRDPRSTGGTGDILLTTVGHSSGDTYNITLWLRKSPN